MNDVPMEPDLTTDPAVSTREEFERETRVTRRLTVWRGSTTDGWTALYHQGTVVG